MKSKLRLLCLFLFLITTAQAQNWSPVMLGEACYYIKSNPGTKEDMIAGTRVDSVIDSSSFKVYKFFKAAAAYNETDWTCQYRSNGPTWLGTAFIRKDNGDCFFLSVYPSDYLADGREYMWNRSMKHKDSVLIRLKAALNVSWTMARDTMGNQIRAKIFMETYENYLGFSDSMKYILLEKIDSNGNLVQDGSFDPDTMVISKNHGLVRAFDFNHIPKYKIALQNYPYQPLSYRRVYNYQPGDIFHYLITDYNFSQYYNYTVLSKDTSSQPGKVTYLLKRLTLKQINPPPAPLTLVSDSVEVTYSYTDSAIHHGLLPYESFYRKNISYKSLLGFTAGQTANRQSEILTDNEIIESDSNTHCFTKKFEGGYWYNTYMEGCGSVTEFRMKGMQDYYTSKTTLIYYKKGSVSWGTPKYVGIEDKALLKLTFTVYPNPGKDILYIQSNSLHISAVEFNICDIRGRCVFSGEAQLQDNYSINLEQANLASGIYFLSITSEGKTGTIKVSIE